MLSRKPAAVTTTNSKKDSVVNVTVKKHKVRYEFDTSASAAPLAIPYAVIVDGKICPGYEHDVRSLNRAERGINIMADEGQRVALYLGADSHPAHRTTPIYEVLVGNKNVFIKIKEKLGRCTEQSTLVQIAPTDEADCYAGTLTGDIWMSITPKFSADQADRLIPAGTSPEIRAAILRIYGGLPYLGMVACLQAGQAAVGIAIGRAENAHHNINDFDDIRDCLPRVHPHCFVALFNAIAAAKLSKVTINSSWRPCFGSITHRLGHGLDIEYLESADFRAILNRRALAKQNAMTSQLVTAEERRAYSEFASSASALEQANRDLKLAAIAKSKAKTSEDRQAAEIAATKANDVLEHARQTATGKQEAWEHELAQNEPAVIQQFRKHLLDSKLVFQLLDPWYCDEDTKDKIPPQANMQLSAIEQQHANHLHITVTGKAL